MYRLVITGVKVGSKAEEIGLQSEDIIDIYDGVEVTSSELLTDIQNRLSGAPSTMVIYRKGGYRFEFNVPGQPIGISVAVENVEQTLGLYKLYEAASRIVVTTTPFIDGYSVKATLDIISAERVMGVDALSEWFLEFTDSMGGQSRNTQSILKNARIECVRELKLEAASIGADAVIGVSLNYSEFSGKGKSMLFMVASGTAVKLNS